MAHVHRALVSIVVLLLAVVGAFAQVAQPQIQPPPGEEYYEVWSTFRTGKMDFYTTRRTKAEAEALVQALGAFKPTPTSEVRGPFGGAGKAVLDRAKLRAQLIKHENKKSKVYLDSEGIPTIGVGFNLKRADAKAKIEALGLDYQKVLAGTQELTEQHIEALLEPDIDAAIAACKKVFPKFEELSDVRQRVLADMMFNLGEQRFRGFVDMIPAIQASDFMKAADEMKDSKWYRQVKTRGVTLVQMMRTNADPK